MQGFGPYALTAGTVLRVQVDPSTASVYIANDAPYDMFVSFAPTQPAPSSILNSDWIGVVQAFHHVVRGVPGAAQLQTPQGALTFMGNVWLLPVNTRNTSLALNGTVSATANAYVEAYLPGEQPPSAYSAPRQTDITSQTRVLTIPVPAGRWESGFYPVTSTAPQTVWFNSNCTNMTVGGSDGNGLNFPYLYNLQNYLNLPLMGYLYDFDLQMTFYNGQTAYPAHLQWQLGMVVLDSSLSVLGFNSIMRGQLGSDGAIYRTGFHPAAPLVLSNQTISYVNGSQPASANQSCLGLSLTSISAQPTYLFWFVAGGFDTNGAGIQPVGSGAAGFIGRTGTVF